MRFFLFLTFSFFIVSCTTTKYCIRSDAKIETLSLCINYSENIPESIREAFNSNLLEFITDFNHDNHKFKLSTCTDSIKSALKLYVVENVLVEPGNQIFSCFVTGIGLSLPFVLIATQSPIIIFFYRIPRDVSQVKLSLTPDIAKTDTAYYKFISNSGFLNSRERQIGKHGLALYDFLYKELNIIEDQYMQNH